MYSLGLKKQSCDCQWKDVCLSKAMLFAKPDATLVDFALPVIALCNLVVVSVSARLFYRRLKRDHDWNRRQATQHLLYEMVTGRFSEIRRRLEVEFGVDIGKDGQTFSSIIATLESSKRQDFLNATKAIFNYFETVSIGIRNHVLQEEICYDHCSTLFVYFRQWGRAYIDEIRTKHPTIWIEFEHFARQWERRLQDEVSSLLPKAKQPT